MQFCPQCGSSNNSGDDFCRSCGAPLLKDVPDSPRSPSSLPVKSATKPRLISEHARQASLRPKMAYSPVRVLGLIGLVLIIAAIAFFVFSGSPLQAGNQNTTGTTQGSGLIPVIGQCSAGLSSCSGKCVDLRTDQDNCGACGFPVPFDETCINGQFSSSTPQNKSKSGSSTMPVGTTSAMVTGTKGLCSPGQTSCRGICRDLRTDNGNCGSCGNTCPSGQTCQNSGCILPGTATPVVSTSAPVTLVSDISCSGRQTLCGNSCVDLFTDKKNCGVCGRTCGSQEICVSARCGPACTKSGTSLCGDTCVDLDTDMNNCGACGTECKTFLPNAKGALCTGGKCMISQCKTDYDDCNNVVSDGCEVYLRTDASNCGSCGIKCDSGQVCYNKKCSVPVGT